MDKIAWKVKLFRACVVMDVKSFRLRCRIAATRIKANLLERKIKRERNG